MNTKFGQVKKLIDLFLIQPNGPNKTRMTASNSSGATPKLGLVYLLGYYKVTLEPKIKKNLYEFKYKPQKVKIIE